MTLFLPGWVKRDLGPDGGIYDEVLHPKVVVHTTEGGSLAGAELAFKDFPPHLGYDPQYRTKMQYVSLDRHSYALKGSESDDEYVIQIEVVGFARQTHQWPEIWYKNFAQDVIAPLEVAIKVPRRHLRFYREGEDGYVLASKYSPIRLSNAAFRAYSGWLGHQHVPNPDEHWDPGGFLMDKAMSYVPGSPAQKEDVVMQVGREKDKPEVWVGDGIHRRWVTSAELVHVESRWGKTQPFNPGTIGVLGDETAESKARRTGQSA